MRGTRLAATTVAFAALVGAVISSTPPALGAPAAAAPPSRIVSLSATATEMLFAIGAGKQVVAVDDRSNFPAAAPRTKLSGYEPNVEAISKYRPDLVVLSGDTKGLVAQLAKLKIPVVVEPAAAKLSDVYDQLTDLGKRTGHANEAKAVVSAMKGELLALTKSVPRRTRPLTYYHELDPTLFSVTSSTFLGALYTMAGLRNVADAADAKGQAGGYPQLSAEYLLKADPDLVFLADAKCCKQSGRTFGARPGFSRLKAVMQRRVVALDDDIASRWGPRVVDLLAAIIAATKVVPVA